MWLLVGFLLLQSAVPVYAAPEDNSVVKAVSGYCLSDELYAFIQIKDGYDVDNFNVNLQSDAVSAAGEQSLEPIAETSATVRYVFMVDLTSSMRKYAQEVNAFVDSLVETEKLQAFYTVAAFGERFEIVSENLTDGNTVKKVLNELEYTEQLTDPYTGVESALTYLDGYSRKSGDLIHLVVITDGDPDLGIEDGEESRKKESELAGAVAQRIGDTPEIIVSTICTDEWDAYAFQALSTGSGIHEMIDSNQDADAAGAKMANYVDSLYRISFKLSAIPEAERFSVELRFRGNDPNGQRAMLNVSMEGVPNLKLFSNGTQQDPDKEKPGNGDIGEIKKPENEGAAEPESTDTKEPGVENVSGAEDTEKVTEVEPEETKQGIDKKLLLTAGVCALVLIVGICTIILMRKRNSRKTGPQPQVKKGAGEAGGIMMKLEVYSGNCVRRPGTICLVDSFVIGSAPECDLVFSDPNVSPKNSRIFVQNQIIYIEDLNSAEGTALGGMRIQSQNRLRSGDVISIGNVEFCFKF